MTDGRKQERRTHFRGKSRPGRRVAIEYCIDGSEPRQAMTRNIGVGGAYIITGQEVAIGQQLRVSIQIPDQSAPIDLSAEVRWIDSAGMGVCFHTLDVDQLLALSEYFATLTGREPLPGEPTE